MKLTCYVEEHRSLGGSIISRLDNGAFVGLIYELLVFSELHVEIVPPVTTILLIFHYYLCLALIEAD